ncbi:MAG: acetate--CoA ligase family protein [Desulfobacter sp.]|nr:MAG: acetate--CoA ligase family protein [Desulfobacter sp.]
MTQNSEHSLDAAQKIGYPVALKGCAWELMHKTESGCIELGLDSPDGVLVQEMVKGPRELVVGLSRDPQFGVCVMIGFGGVMAEVVGDRVFRVAPFDRIEALDMINELNSRPMLDRFRGQSSADLEGLCQLLEGLGQFGLDNPSVREIDINPLIVSQDGSIRAADALIILKKGGSDD